MSIIQPVDKQAPETLEDVADLVEEGKFKLLLLDSVLFRLDDALVRRDTLFRFEPPAFIREERQRI